MPDQGQFVINSDGQFFLQPDGSWAVFDSAGECSPCCGGGPVDPLGACATYWPQTRSFTCPLNNQATTIASRNSWSDGFGADLWESDVVTNYPYFGRPLCGNYYRYGVGATDTVLASTELTPISLGGSGNLIIRSGLAYRIYLVNGPGLICDSQFTITVRGTGTWNGFNTYGALGTPGRMSIGISVAGSAFPADSGYFLSVNASQSPFRWQIGSTIIGPVAKNDVITLRVRQEHESLGGTNYRRLVTVWWSINALAGSVVYSPVNFVAQVSPIMCGVSHYADLQFSSGIYSAFDNYSGSVINPYYIAA